MPKSSTLNPPSPPPPPTKSVIATGQPQVADPSLFSHKTFPIDAPLSYNTTFNAPNGSTHFTLKTDSDGKIKSGESEGVNVYDATLPAWRAAIRRPLIRATEWESKILARMQVDISLPTSKPFGHGWMTTVPVPVLTILVL